MSISQAGIDAVVAEPKWRRYREVDSITHIAGTPTVVTRVLIRVLPNVPREDLDAVKVYLGTVTEYSGPMTGQGRVQAGTWKNGGHYVDREAVDGNAEPGWNLYQVLWQGTGASLTYFEEKSCRYTVEAIKYYGLATPPTLPAPANGVTYSMGSTQQDGQTGLWTVTVLKRTRLPQNLTYTSEITAAVTEATEKNLGMTTEPPPIVQGDGQAVQRDMNRNEDCSIDKVDQTRTITNQRNTVDEVEAGSTATTVIDTAVNATTGVPTTPPVPADGEAKTVRIVQNPDFKNRAEVQQRTETIVNQQHADAVATAAVATATTVDTAMDTATLPTNPPVPSAAQAKTLRIVRDPKFKNRARVEQTTETITNQQHTEAQAEAAVAVVGTIDTALSTGSLPTNPPVPAAGEAKSLRITRDPKFKDVARVEAVTETITNQQHTEAQAQAAVATATTVDTAMDTASLPTNPPAALPGQSKSLRIVRDPKFKNRARVEQTTRTVTNQQHAVAEAQAAVSSSGTIDTAMPVASLPTNPPVPAAGEAKSLRITKDPEFKDVARVEVVTETITNQQATDADAQAAVSRVATVNTAVAVGSLPTTPPVPADGEAKSLQITPDPKFKDVSRVTAVTETITNQQHAEAQATASVATATTVDTAMDTASLPANPPVALPGQAKSLRIVRDPKFKNRARVEQTTRTVTNQQHTVAEATASVASVGTIDTATPVGSLPTTPPTPAAAEAKTLRITRDSEFKDVARVEAVTETITNQQHTDAAVRADRSSATTVDTALPVGSLPTTPPTLAAGQSKTLRIVRDPKFKDVARVEQQTSTAVKLEKETTWTDADGAKRDYVGLHLTAAEVELKRTTLTPGTTVEWNCTPDQEFSQLFNLSFAERPSNWRAASSAEYDLIGEFIEPWRDRDTRDEYARVTLYTSSKTRAQDYAKGTDATVGALFGKCSDLDAATVTGLTSTVIKTAWTTSDVVESQVYRNRGTGRYVAMRVQKKLT